MSLSQKIKHYAHEIGFELVGIAPVQPVPELAFYIKWLEAGYAGEMEYLKTNAGKKADTNQVVPEAKSIIVCAKIYHTAQPLSINNNDKTRGWISRYSWGDDYHDFLQKKLFELSDFIKKESRTEFISRLYVDTGPVIDRVYAKYAGIGWFGKNTCIINQQKGSWFFIGEIITNLELDYDALAPDRCGSCNKCMEACPTDAILEPYVLDSRRCISYLTIELKNDIPVEFRDGIGNHVFGCDICQDVCPWNRKAQTTTDIEFQPRESLVNPSLEYLAGMSIEEFKTLFKNSPIKRSRYKGFIRNVVIAMGNSGDSRFIPILKKLSEHEENLIASHAKWALTKLTRLL